MLRLLNFYYSIGKSKLYCHEQYIDGDYTNIRGIKHEKKSVLPYMKIIFQTAEALNVLMRKVVQSFHSYPSKGHTGRQKNIFFNGN